MKIMGALVLAVALMLLPSSYCVAAFCILPSTTITFHSHSHTVSTKYNQQHYCSHACSCTHRWMALLDVPDDFFTILLPSLSLFLAFSKAVARSRLEERAWEQRLEQARAQQLEKDPTLTLVDLQRQEAAAEWSAYGNPLEKEESFSTTRRRRRRRVMTRDENATPEDIRREFQMTEEEIQDFEEEFGVEFDPYYDDPYTEDELPDDVPYKVDKLYGDRIYKDGEIFYKDATSGLYYRQGSQPRIQKFW